MLDAIGMGKAIANMIYMIIAILILGGSSVLMLKKKILSAILWTSVLLNIFVFLYFMGKDIDIWRVFIEKLWPVVNIILLLILLINFLRRKYGNKKA